MRVSRSRYRTPQFKYYSGIYGADPYSMGIVADHLLVASKEPSVQDKSAGEDSGPHHTPK